MLNACRPKQHWLTLVAVVFWTICSNAQSTVSGTVTGSDGMSLIGVTITAEGTSTGTVTDVDGSYSLRVPAGATATAFSYTGFKREVVEINGRSIIDLVMTTDWSLQKQSMKWTARALLNCM